MLHACVCKTSLTRRAVGSGRAGVYFSYSQCHLERSRHLLLFDSQEDDAVRLSLSISMGTYTDALHRYSEMTDEQFALAPFPIGEP